MNRDRDLAIAGAMLVVLALIILGAILLFIRIVIG